jgi:cyclopropane fatty-acyl-phospholipid synthase-like methyltransferase
MYNMYENGTYLRNNATWHAEDSSWKAEQIIQLIKKNGISASTICEIGCGAGEILNELRERFHDEIKLYGYEISAAAFELCKRKAKKNLIFLLRDLLEEDEGGFDIVLAIDVVEHVEDYMTFLRKLRHKGAYKIFHIPLDLSVQSVLRSSPLLVRRKRIGHIHYFTKETALATLKDCGYKVIDFTYTRPSLELPHRGWKANLLKMPRALAFALSQDLGSRLLGGFSLLVLAK